MKVFQTDQIDDNSLTKVLQSDRSTSAFLKYLEHHNGKGCFLKLYLDISKFKGGNCDDHDVKMFLERLGLVVVVNLSLFKVQSKNYMTP